MEPYSQGTDAFANSEMVRPPDILLDGEKMPHKAMGRYKQATVSRGPGKSAQRPVPDKVYLQWVLVQRIGIEHADRFISFALGAHRNKGKPPGCAARIVHYEINRSDFPCPCKQCG